MDQVDADTFFLGDFDPDQSFDDAVDAAAAQWPCDWGVYWGLDSSHAPRYLGPDPWDDVLALNRHAQRLVAAATQLIRRKLPEDRRTLPEWLRTESELQRQQFDEAAESLRGELSLDQLEDSEWQTILDMVEGETPAERRERFFRTTVQIHAFE